jgi:hypothetical protein
MVGCFVKKLKDASRFQRNVQTVMTAVENAYANVQMSFVKKQENAYQEYAKTQIRCLTKNNVNVNAKNA